MDRGLAILLTVAAGGLIALQAPVNSALSKAVGTLAGASLSLVLGAVVMVAVTLIVEGFGRLPEAAGLPWHYFTGGLIGAAYITVALLTVRALGAGGVTAATITGQLIASLAIDRLGVLGLEPRGLDTGRLLGVVLLVAGTVLVARD